MYRNVKDITTPDTAMHASVMFKSSIGVNFYVSGVLSTLPPKKRTSVNTLRDVFTHPQDVKTKLCQPPFFDLYIIHPTITSANTPAYTSILYNSHQDISFIFSFSEMVVSNFCFSSDTSPISR